MAASRSGPRIDADVPRVVQAFGVTIFAVHVLSYAVLRGVTPRHLFSPDLLVGAATTWPFAAAMVYGGRWLERSDVSREYHDRIRNWFLGGLVGFLGLNLVMIAAWPAGSTYNNIAWALFAASVGGAAGFGIGLFQARRVREAVRADRQRRKRRETEERNERLIDFAESVAHDLRNPLNVAAGNLELARREPKEEFFENVEEAHERMATLVDQSLDLARSGREIDETEPVELSEVAERCWSTVPTPGADLQIEGSTTIEADPDRLTQLLENLFRNAMEHGADHGSKSDSASAFYRGAASRAPYAETDETGDTDGDAAAADRDDVVVTVSVGPLSDGAGFYVADDGPGIPESDRSRVLESGFSSNEEGSGLGLAIVQRVAEAHGWRVAVGESDAGGARFEFRVDDE